ncbi:acyl-CoA dehydrogenase family protein, partial [Achromobacter sp. Marseille-Q0513]|uniref:acyl-CoA dehydrogenase family protein n=1 Tax=Achromobacter sp. Marseille-Q0513 TaxID=2829161 RepID=UPI002012BA3E
MTATQALTDTGARSWLPAELRDWLDAHAQALDEGAEDPASVLPRLAEAGVFRLGVPASQGGLEGSDAGDAIEAVSQLAEHSVAAAFVAWGQRVFIEYLLHSPNQALARDWTGPLLRGELAGATALSNAMKFLSGIESLQISARQDGDDWVLDGRMPWVTNLRPDGFLVAAASSPRSSG